MKKEKNLSSSSATQANQYVREQNLLTEAGVKRTELDTTLSQMSDQDLEKRAKDRQAALVKSMAKTVKDAQTQFISSANFQKALWPGLQKMYGDTLNKEYKIEYEALMKDETLTPEEQKYLVEMEERYTNIKVSELESNVDVLSNRALGIMKELDRLDNL
jgi:hypothetical protein